MGNGRGEGLKGLLQRMEGMGPTGSIPKNRGGRGRLVGRRLKIGRDTKLYSFREFPCTQEFCQCGGREAFSHLQAVRIPPPYRQGIIGETGLPRKTGYAGIDGLDHGRLGAKKLLTRIPSIFDELRKVRVEHLIF